MLKNKVIEHIYKFNNNIGEVSVKYLWKVLPWIISRRIKLLEKSIYNLHFIHTLTKTTQSMHLTHMLT